MPSVNRIFPLRLLTAGAISLFLNITGAIAPMAPVLNTPLELNHHPLRKSNFNLADFFQFGPTVCWWCDAEGGDVVGVAAGVHESRGA